jgi:hypothetical protein
METLELKKLTMDDLRKVTWDYTSEEVIGEYNNQAIRSYLWEIKRCGDVNPLTVQRCNISEGWVEYFKVKEPFDKSEDWKVILANIEMDVDRNNILITRKECKVVVDLYDTKARTIVTLD